MTGAITLVAGIGKLGFVADLISKPTMIGYMNGLALTILVGQLPKLCGFSVDAEGFLGEVAGFVQGIGAGETVPAAVAVGLGGLILILALQRLLPKVPAVLVVVVLSIGAAGFLGLEQHGLSVVGVLPQGFPRSRSRGSPCPTSRCCWRARWPSRSSRWPTPSRRRARSRHAAGRPSTATGR